MSLIFSDMTGNSSSDCKFLLLYFWTSPSFSEVFGTCYRNSLSNNTKYEGCICSVIYAALTNAPIPCFIPFWFNTLCKFIPLLNLHCNFWLMTPNQGGRVWRWITAPIIFTIAQCILILSKSFYFTNGCTIYLFRSTLKFTTKIAPTCFGLSTILREHLIDLS